MTETPQPFVPEDSNVPQIVESQPPAPEGTASLVEPGSQPQSLAEMQPESRTADDFVREAQDRIADGTLPADFDLAGYKAELENMGSYQLSHVRPIRPRDASQ